MERTSPSPLAQAFAALFTALIAALAEHAAEHPLLAPGIRASMRELEKLAKKLDRMVAEWEATRSTLTKQPPRSAGVSLPPSRTQAIRKATTRRREAMPSRRRPAAMWNPASAPRAPPHPDSAPPRAPPTPNPRPESRKTPPDSLRPGARRMYPVQPPPAMR